MNDLVMAGELQYIGKSMQDIALDIMKNFDGQIPQNQNEFIQEILLVVMYLLKREDNLTQFIDKLKTEIGERSIALIISERFVIDTLLRNSNRSLHCRLLWLLSKRNPVPMVEPSLDSNPDDYRLTPDIIDVWDYERPILLSFGFDVVKGKSTLLNELFLSSFEESTSHNYFHGTVDLDFGYHFSPRRPINLADVHGEIKAEWLGKVSKLFSGFLIHVESSALFDNIHTIVEQLKRFGDGRYIQLIIRDLKPMDKSNFDLKKSALLSEFPMLKIHSLPNTSNPNKADVKTKIDGLRKAIFEEAISYPLIDEKELRTMFKSILPDSERTMKEQHEKFIDDVRPVLINGSDDQYPLYSLYEKMSQTKLMISKRDPYQAYFHDSEIFNLHRDSYKFDCDFATALKSSPFTCGKGFEKFFHLIQDPASRLKNLSLLAMELQRERGKRGSNQMELAYYQRLSIELHWRNALIGLNSLTADDRKIILDAYRDYISDGNPFEIIDGDNFQMQTDALEEVFTRFTDKKIFVLTVVGPQNSGKSTLLNVLFGTSFEARDGRCTRGKKTNFNEFSRDLCEENSNTFLNLLILGMYGTLVDVSRVSSKEKLIPLEYDYILVIDTEGILGAQKGDDEYSKRLLLFSLAVSHLVIINNASEIDETIKNMLVLCTQSLKYIGETRVKSPAVHLVLNKRDNLDPDYCNDLLNRVRDRLRENQLQDIIKLEEKNVHELKTAFVKKQWSGSIQDCTAFLIDEKFVMGVQQLGRLFIDESIEIVKQNDHRFCIPSRWMQYTGRVFQAIKRHPNIAKFKEVYERQQYEELLKKLRKDFERQLSPIVGNRLIEENKLLSVDAIKGTFEDQRKTISSEFTTKLNRYREKNEITTENYERLSSFIETKLRCRIRSWEVTTISASDRYTSEKVLQEVERRLQEKVQIITYIGGHLDEKSAHEYFDEEFDRMLPKMKQFELEDLWKNAKAVVSYLWIIFDIDDLPTESDLTHYSSFLQSLDHSLEQSVAIQDCLNKICEKCIQEASQMQSIVGDFNKDSLVLPTTEITKNRTYLKSEELTRIHGEIQHKLEFSRGVFRRGIRLTFLEEFERNYKTILREQECLENLMTAMKIIFNSTTPNEYDSEVKLGEKIINKVSEIIKDFNEELNVFDFCLSDEFRCLLYRCAVLSAITFYYAGEKDHIVNSINETEAKKTLLVQRFLPLILLEKSEDEDHATHLTAKLLDKMIGVFKTEIEKVITETIQSNAQTLEKRWVIQELDKKVCEETTDDYWVVKYVLDPIKIIVEQFDENWKAIETEVKEKFDLINERYLQAVADTFECIVATSNELRTAGGQKLNFVDELFRIEDVNNNVEKSEKRLGMAKLFYEHFTGQSASDKLTIRNKTYLVNDIWKKIVIDCKPKEEVKKMFGLTTDEWGTFQITYPGKFLEHIIDLKGKMEQHVMIQCKNTIDDVRSSWYKIHQKKLYRCVALCPCCKRVCDFNHDENTRIGHGENKHRCELGHQLRGMAGVYYEMNHEASLLLCENLRDDDVVKVDGKRQLWKKFKRHHEEWLFDDRNTQVLENSRHAATWDRIGEKLCDHYKNGMKFVTQNSPLLINHFIFVLDHSGSMNDIPVSAKNIAASLDRNSINPEDDTEEVEVSPWKHLLRAIEVFVDIRKQMYSLTDQITAIVFAERVKKVFTRCPLTAVRIVDLDIPMNICGGGTNYKAALESVLETLNEVRQDPIRNQLRQTIVFMTDGEPQGYPTDALNRLHDYREST